MLFKLLVMDLWMMVSIELSVFLQKMKLQLQEQLVIRQLILVNIFLMLDHQWLLQVFKILHPELARLYSRQDMDCFLVINSELLRTAHPNPIIKVILLLKMLLELILLQQSQIKPYHHQ